MARKICSAVRKLFLHPFLNIIDRLTTESWKRDLKEYARIEHVDSGTFYNWKKK